MATEHALLRKAASHEPDEFGRAGSPLHAAKGTSAWNNELVLHLCSAIAQLFEQEKWLSYHHAFLFVQSFN